MAHGPRHAIVAIALLMAVVAPGRAQTDREPLSIVPRTEAEALRKQLATPAPASASPEELRRHYVAALEAAQRLADRAARRRVLEEAVVRLPDDARWHNDLAILLRDEGEWAASRRQQEQAIALARDPVQRLFYETNLVGWMVLRPVPEARERLLATRSRAQEASADAKLPPRRRVLAQRTLGRLAALESILLARQGRGAERLEAAVLAERHARAAVEEAQRGGSETTLELNNAATDYVLAQRRHAQALRALERDAEAEAVLRAHVADIARLPVSADFAAGAHAALAGLRMDQREFAEAERQWRLALRVQDRVGVAADAPARSELVAEIALSLWAQRQWRQALAELDRLDRAARDAPAAARAGSAARTKPPAPATAPASPTSLTSLTSKRHPFTRGVVLLGAGQADQAAPLLEVAARNRERDRGAGHYDSALARGLHGAALWAGRNAAGRERAPDLLKQAVLDMHAPRNADFMTDRGLRRPLRETVYAAYVEAMSVRGGLPALWAMGVADGLRSGITAEAMADAAVRAAAADPELSVLVRQEQDAKRDLQAAEALLQSRDPAERPSAGAAAALRSRIAEVETRRQQLQLRIRERFPGYDRVLHPPLPDPGQVGQRLARGESLLLLVPGERALLAWLVSADELPQFFRIDVRAAELRTLVGRVRRGLDFSAGAPPTFDRAAAVTLYQRVLGPLESRLASQRQLVISASGPLATLPFATLLGAARPGEAPGWLVQRWALVQVPSVSAWLALREMQRTQPAPEPLLAWGDPTFSAQVAQADRRKGLAGGRSAAATLRYDELPPLPETRDELRAIATALKADPAHDLLLGSAATRASLLEASRSGRLARKKVVVFATHGLMAGELPGLTQPALALAATPSARPDDVLPHLLTLDDVLTLRLNADWVVLSACNTAAADGRAEEALSGLARGFFYAGSRSLLVTQWAIETESAKRLTSATFEHHARMRDASKAESLRQAMLALMAEPRYAHPAFWAPYMLVGDGAR